MKKSAQIFLLLFIIAPYSHAQSNQFSSNRGYSLIYPKGWVVVTGKQRNQLSFENRSLFNKLGNIDFNRIDAIFFSPVNDGFIENINVVVSPGKMPIDKKSETKIVQTMRQQFRSWGVSVSNIRGKQERFGKNRAISVSWEILDPQTNMRVKQWQVALPGNNQTYIVTSSSAASDYYQYESQFRVTLNSISIDAGIAGIWLRLPKWARNAIIGAVFGLIIAALSSVFKQKPANVEPDYDKCKRSNRTRTGS